MTTLWELDPAAARELNQLAGRVDHLAEQLRQLTPKEAAELSIGGVDTDRYTARVLNDVRIERDRQVADLGWTPEHDVCHHSTHDMVRLAERYAHKTESDRDEHQGLYSRRRLVQAVALLVAAVEAMDRREGR